MAYCNSILRASVLLVGVTFGALSEHAAYGVVNPCSILDEDAKLLLCSIKNCFDEDSVRLIFADRLQELGQEKRAQFIRVQIAKERVLKESPEWKALDEQEAKLVEGIDLKDWMDVEVQEIYNRLAFPRNQRKYFKRGFANQLVIGVEQFRLFEEKLKNIIPTKVIFTIKSVLDLGLLGNVLNSPAAKIFTGIELWPPVQVPVGLEEVFNRALLTAPNLNNLRSFELHPNFRLSSTTYSANIFRSVEVLKLAGSEIQKIVDSKSSALANVRNLQIELTNLDAIQALPKSPFKELEALWIHFNQPLDTGASGAFKDLAKSPMLRNLKTLYLNGSQRGEYILELMRASNKLEKLKLIDMVSPNYPVDHESNYGYLNQIEATEFANIQYLDIGLYHSRVFMNAIKVIGDRNLFPNLRVLDISGHPVSPDVEQMLQQFQKDRGGPEKLRILTVR